MMQPRNKSKHVSHVFLTSIPVFNGFSETKGNKNHVLHASYGLSRLGLTPPPPPTLVVAEIVVAVVAVVAEYEEDIS